MAAKKTTEIKGNSGEVLMSIEEEVQDTFKAEILYEEDLISVKEAGKPRYFKLLKSPYLEFHGSKVYLSRQDIHNIESGETTPDKILATIVIEDNYKA